MKSIKKICCIGAGYVGGPTMAVIADKCSRINVNVVDINEERIAAWNCNNYEKLPVYEPGLKDILKRCRNRNLFFSNEIEKNIADSDMIFISVNTPTKTKGIGAGQASNLKWIEACARQIGKYAKGKTIVVEKSTLPVKTAKTIKSILQSFSKIDDENKIFHILSNPEFLAEGTAINDLEKPDRVLIGGEDQEAIDSLKEIYLNWINEEKILTTDLWSSELSKLIANAFLAQRVSSINSISALCESTQANINEVAKAIGMDTRIGKYFLKSGPGFGGSCFKKDILNLIYICNHYGLDQVATYWENVITINNWQQQRITQIIVNKMFGNVDGKKISILGFAFKANTNDTRESPAIKICNDLIEEGCFLSIYDPEVDIKQITLDLDQKPVNDKLILQNSSCWEYASTIQDSALNSDAIVILSDWDNFYDLDFENLINIMRKPSWIFDTRNVVDISKAIKYGFNVWSLGNGNIN
tara:strand:+ start:27668 stop:29080 length:1413 start_codon:yes stop_codon:yes gene_type:complete